MEASTWMVTGFVPLKYLSELADVTACLTLSTARWCSGPHWNSFSFLIRSQRQADKDAKLGTNRLRNCTILRKVCRSARLCDGSMLLIALIFCRSGLRLPLLAILPKKGTSVHLILHFSRLRRIPVSRAHSMTALRFASRVM